MTDNNKIDDRKKEKKKIFPILICLGHFVRFFIIDMAEAINLTQIFHSAI